MAIFPSFYFRQYRPGKCVLRYSRRKKRLSRLGKQEVKKDEKFRFFPKGLTHGFGPKMAIFPTFFLGNIGQEKFFYDILEQIDAFLGYKNEKVKNCQFSKGVNPWFWSKNGHFSNFFLGNIGQENVFYDILERKNAFLGYKNKKFKKSKNWDFCKRFSPWFWSKIGHFSLFDFRQYKPGKCVLRYFRTKKTPF